MNAALLVGVAVVLPLALQERFRFWLVSAVGVLISLVLPAGPLAGLALAPWVLLTVVTGLRALAAREFWRAMIAGFAGTASIALVFSRIEFTLFGILEPIVKLTALHFTYAGAGTLSLAHRLVRVRPSTASRIARAIVFVAPPVVALGFITRSAVGQLGGALLMTAGVYSVALLQLRDARTSWLWKLSCASPWVAMGLGVSWAANQYFPQVPALTVPDMVPTHGALNAFGFVLCGVLAMSKPLTGSLEIRRPAVSDNKA